MSFTTHPSLEGHRISRSAFLKRAASFGTPFDKLVVGVAIVHPLTSTTKPLQILLVQRAAHEKLYPGVYELPGGHVEDTDKTILDAAAREVAEETGLILSNIVGEIPPFDYKILAVEEGAVKKTIVKSTIQLNFVAQVVPLGSSNAFEVKLNPEEHQNYAWVSKEDFGLYDITRGMREVVKNALVWAEENLERFDTEVVTE